MLAKGIALIDQSAWAGADVAFFGRVGANPPTNDGTIAGLMVGHSVSLYAANSGSASTNGAARQETPSESVPQQNPQG